MDEQSKEYRQGFEDGVRELAQKLETYYRCLGASPVLGYMVGYTADVHAKELIERKKDSE